MPDSLSQIVANVIAFLPTLLLAILILVVGWIIAAIISRIVGGLLGRTNLDNRIASSMQGERTERIPVERWISTTVFWLIMVFVIVIFLQTLNLGQISEPLNLLLAQILGFIPNLIAAALLGLVAFVIATVLRVVISRVLSSSLFTRRVTEEANMEPTNQQTIGQTIGNVVFWLVLLLFLPAILDALDLGGLLAPVQTMINGILGALPAVFAALLLLVIAYFVARFVGNIVSGLLSGIGFNRLFGPSGIIPVTGTAEATASREVQVGRTTPSQIVGTIVTIAILLFAAMEAANLLGFETLTVLLGSFIAAAGNVLVGLIIFGIGLYLANTADRMIRNTGSSQANVLAPAARIAIIVFSAALALRQMGLGEDIVNLAFGLLLGAIAVAAALAFGLGGREAAADALDRWRNRIREEASKPPRPAPVRSQRQVEIPVTSGPEGSDDRVQVFPAEKTH